ncbi:MAG: hypothetical protein NT038_00615 [Euryarchaeota archaeon]|nr:hypothetical protein [Euryarchaeota archaeon]
MLIIISPQYANDQEIQDAINSYVTAVKNDIAWTTKIITLTKKDNTYTTIDQIIDIYSEKHPIKACLIVGEDTDTALAGDCDYMEKPSTREWSVTNHQKQSKENGCEPYTPDICISLLYPTHDLTYETKKSQLINAFNKFATQRHIQYNGAINTFESSNINTYSKELYQNLETYGTLLYDTDPGNEQIQKSLIQQYSLYFIHGHSNPAGTKLNTKNEGWFSASFLEELNTPFFAADGCYVGGWWSKQQDNEQLDTSIDANWYGSQILTSKHIQVMALGLLSQQGYTTSVSFIENAVPDLIEGKTLAEAVIGDTYVEESFLVYGDPTFHFTVLQ